MTNNDLEITFRKFHFIDEIPNDSLIRILIPGFPLIPGFLLGRKVNRLTNNFCLFELNSGYKGLKNLSNLMLCLPKKEFHQ